MSVILNKCEWRKKCLGQDTVNLEYHAQQHSILSKIENVFFLELTGKEQVLVCLGFFCFVLLWVEVFLVVGM